MLVRTLDRMPALSTSDKVTHVGYLWPAPPYACFPAATPQTAALTCRIDTQDGRRLDGQMTFFVPENGTAYFQLPPARTAVAMRLEELRAITLTDPLRPSPLQQGEVESDAMGHGLRTHYRVVFKNGKELRGVTVGHVENGYGLFLFDPVENLEANAVRRVFIPSSAYDHVEFGRNLGEVLIEFGKATPDDISAALAEQARLKEQKLGDLLLTRRVVTPEQLMEALDRQSRMPMIRVGEALLSLGMVTQAQLDDALAQQQLDRNVPLGEVLIRNGVLTPHELREALARKMGYPVVNVDDFPVEAEALRKLSFSVTRRLRVMPLLIRNARLIVALEDPAQRHSVLDEVEFVADMKVVPVLAQCVDLQAALLRAYERIGSAPVDPLPIDDLAQPLDFAPVFTTDLVASLEKEGQSQDDEDPEPTIEQSDNSLVQLINQMIIEAWQQGASDIHIESNPGREKIRIRFRKDGLLRPYLTLASAYRSAMIARIKIMCDLDISERRRPQDGKINFARHSPLHRIELRVATVPTANGLEDVVMRILSSAKPMPMDRLDLSSSNLERLTHAIERPHGLVLCVGPTGSGKTTTLHSALSHLNVPERKIWTAEDPIEITQPGLRQVQLNSKIEWSFAKALRTFLRADPDVIMVGEIRDRETAQIAVEASLTGHLVLSTLHTNSAPETIGRLLDMGMDPFNFADSLLAVLAQRLVRRLCMHCRTSRPATPAEVEELVRDYRHAYGSVVVGEGEEDLLQAWRARHGVQGQIQMHESRGCTHCDHTGYSGRVAIHELMTNSRDLRRLIQSGAPIEQIQSMALQEGMRSLRHDGIEKALAGITSIEEVRGSSNL